MPVKRHGSTGLIFNKTSSDSGNFDSGLGAYLGEEFYLPAGKAIFRFLSVLGGITSFTVVPQKKATDGTYVDMYNADGIGKIDTPALGGVDQWMPIHAVGSASIVWNFDFPPGYYKLEVTLTGGTIGATTSMKAEAEWWDA